MSEVTATLQVTSFHPGELGGGALLGRELNQPSSGILRALVAAHVLPREPLKGEVWRVSGPTEPRSVFDYSNGREVKADHIIAKSAMPVELRGKAITHWIATHPDINGVGIGYAERLWDAYGQGLYDILRQRDLAPLARVLDFTKAAAIVDAFGLLQDEISALEELDSIGLDGRTAKAAIALYGSDAGRRFRDNPYMLAILEPWRKVDASARSSGVTPDDERRLQAAVEAALSYAWRRGGHTAVHRPDLIFTVGQLLGRSGEHLAAQAVDEALGRGDLTQVKDGLYQGRAAWHIEREIEVSIAQRRRRQRQPLDRAIVEVVIADIEREDSIRFEREQRQAVHLALSNSISAVAGGAGTGKTTIVKAIMRAALRMQRGDYIQIALSGRAAKRLSEATGRPALTIYRFLKDVQYGRITAERGLLVIDEFSMVSTPDFWMILTSTPITMDILLVGDPGQLPPIAAGNPANAVFSPNSIPQVKLSVPHRQSTGSPIPAVANNIRHGVQQDFREFDFQRPHAPGVHLLPCSDADVREQTLSVFEALAGCPPTAKNKQAVSRIHAADVQILTMTKALAVELGKKIEQRWMASQPLVHNWGFHVGSKLLWVKNTYDHQCDLYPKAVDIMNGALGVIQDTTQKGAEVRFDDDAVTEIRLGHLDRVLHGWAITVHKAQGSAFRHVIIPVTRTRLLDRAMLYTAVTRARTSATLIGDPETIANAIRSPPRVRQRRQALDLAPKDRES